MKRVPTAELLDTDSGTPAEVAASLGDLRRINRWFGGVATTEDMVGRVARETGAVVPVAAGSCRRIRIRSGDRAPAPAAPRIAVCKSRCSIALRPI